VPRPTADVLDLPALPTRAADSNKGDFGRVLIVAGSRGMSGAAVLCGLSALRGGAGLVRVATADAQPLVAAANPCLMTYALPQDGEGRISHAALNIVRQEAKKNTVLALGPGLGQSDDLSRLVPDLLETAGVPIVLDADGLNALLGDVSRLSAHKSPVVITPHPGEFARLIGATTKEVQAQRREKAEAFAQQHNVVVVLKGHQTIVTDGVRTYTNTTGNPGMATAGSGDVLTGLLAALIAQRLTPFDAARLAVHLHGAAGDLAAQHLGQISLIATDLIQYLPRAILNFDAPNSNKPTPPISAD